MHLTEIGIILFYAHYECFNLQEHKQAKKEPKGLQQQQQIMLFLVLLE